MIGFRVQGSRFRVQGSGFKVQGSRFKVQGSRFKVQKKYYKRDRLSQTSNLTYFCHLTSPFSPIGLAQGMLLPFAFCLFTQYSILNTQYSILNTQKRRYFRDHHQI
ncbi:hypothetical protein DDZ15_15290 [Rhodohalobacter mucosus]|uniref:Uncharacterized protein n=1 Tax=Rhodohalobacter mucosus TaxID=2079485 RepID=A0A316TLH9_9BACT|nr:hypothetical protein DDZ15_15290 [Rhodohalobacter mucosus]